MVPTLVENSKFFCVLVVYKATYVAEVYNDVCTLHVFYRSHTGFVSCQNVLRNHLRKRYRGGTLLNSDENLYY